MNKSSIHIDVVKIKKPDLSNIKSVGQYTVFDDRSDKWERIKKRKNKVYSKFIYEIILYSHKECFYKIGSTKDYLFNTNSKRSRYNDFIKKGYKIIEVAVSNSSAASVEYHEESFHDLNLKSAFPKLKSYTPKIYFTGKTECYEIPWHLMPIKKVLNKLYMADNRKIIRLQDCGKTISDSIDWILQRAVDKDAITIEEAIKSKSELTKNNILQISLLKDDDLNNKYIFNSRLFLHSKTNIGLCANAPFVCFIIPEHATHTKEATGKKLRT